MGTSADEPDVQAGADDDNGRMAPGYMHDDTTRICGWDKR